MQPSQLPLSTFRVGALALSLASGSLACGGAEPSPVPPAPTAESATRVEAPPQAEAPSGASSEEGFANPPPAGAMPTLNNLVTAQALLVSLLLAPFSTPTTSDPVGVPARPPQTTVRRIRRTST